MKETLIIAGLGRCGTSLTMQMLDRGGFPVMGDYPSYEGYFNHQLEIKQSTVDEAAGKALKVIDPHLAVAENGINFSNCKAIYLTRDLDQQARSQIKMASLMFSGGPDYSRKRVRAMKSGLARQNHQAAKAFDPRNCLTWRFESLLKNPEGFLSTVSKFTGRDINIGEGIKAVVHRRPECLAGFLELDLMEAK